MADYKSHAWLWSGLATYNGSLYRFDLVTTIRLQDADVGRAVSKAGGHVKNLVQPEDLNESDLFVRVMNWGSVKYDVLFRPDKRLTTGVMNKKTLRVRMRGNFSRVYDGEFQELRPAVRNPPRPRPVQQVTRFRRR